MAPEGRRLIFHRRKPPSEAPLTQNEPKELHHHLYHLSEERFPASPSVPFRKAARNWKGNSSLPLRDQNPVASGSRCQPGLPTCDIRWIEASSTTGLKLNARRHSTTEPVKTRSEP